MQEAYYKKPLEDIIYIKGSAYEFGNETAGKTTYNVFKNRILKVNIDIKGYEGDESVKVIEKINNAETVKPREITKKLIGKNNNYETYDKGEQLNTVEIGEEENITKFIENNEEKSQKVSSYA